jgi:histidine ammonia-lyase
MMLEYTAAAAAAEARLLAGAMATQAVWASLGIESHASLAATAAAHTDRVLGRLRILVAIELVAAVRALALAGRMPTGPAPRSLYEAASRALPTGRDDRQFGRDVEIAQDLLSGWRAPA